MFSVEQATNICNGYIESDSYDRDEAFERVGRLEDLDFLENVIFAPMKFRMKGDHDSYDELSIDEVFRSLYVN
jgi:hypothetical protein